MNKEKIIFDYSNLRSAIKKKCKNTTIFADLMDLSRQQVSKKLNNQAYWCQADIQKACELLEIQPYEIGVYFFEISETDNVNK